VDTLVLGCTHYPLLTGLLSVVMGPQVTLVSSAEETAQELYRVLTAAGSLRPDDAQGGDSADSTGEPVHVFRTTGESDTFLRRSERFLGPRLVGRSTTVRPPPVPAYGSAW
jgi:glutamate racemase